MALARRAIKSAFLAQLAAVSLTSGALVTAAVAGVPTLSGRIAEVALYGFSCAAAVALRASLYGAVRAVRSVSRIRAPRPQLRAGMPARRATGFS